MFLTNLPNFIVMAPSDEIELARMIKTACKIDSSPCAIRYPRGEGYGLKFPKEIKAIRIGKAKIIKKGSQVAILSLGTQLNESIKAAHELQKNNIDVTIVDLRFAKPLDKNLIIDIAKSHKAIITIEEGSSGGVASGISLLLNNNNLSDKVIVKNLFMPDRYFEHASVEKQLEEAGLTSSNIVKTVKEIINL